ncbi:MAG: ABC transporter substrate-binding protein [Burkholderiales bacterium]|nr:MAG: ABC transporter substrate-binding protein [Burkholderiales bacterium]
MPDLPQPLLTEPEPRVNACSASVPRRQALACLAGSALLAAGGPWWSQTASAASPSPSTSGDRNLPRLVTAGGALTEIVYALGAQAQLVGTDTTSLYPPQAQQTPKVGYLRQLSAEGLLSLRPDALIATADAGPSVVLDQLRSARVHVELVSIDHTWDEVGRKVAAVGRAARRESQAMAYLAELTARWTAVQARVQAGVQARARRPVPSVLFVLAHAGSPMVSGRATAADAVIRLAGCRNALQAFSGYRPMTAEAMAAAAPDVIVMTTQGLEAVGGTEKFWQRPELALTPAWRRRERARTLVDMDALALLGFGPRLPEVVWQLHESLMSA